MKIGPMEEISGRLAPLPPLPMSGPPRVGPRRTQRRRGLGRRWLSRVPWTIYGYMAGEVLRLLVLGVLAVSLLYVTLAAYQTVRSGIQLNFIWPLIVKTFAYPLYFSIPIALLFAVTLVVGRMTGDLEVAALQTHGLGHVHVYVPILSLGLVLTVVAYYLNGWVVPQIHYEKRNLQSYVLSQLENLGSGVNRTILLGDEEGSIWVQAYKGTRLHNVRVDLLTQKDSTVLQAVRDHLPDKLPNRVTILARDGEIVVRPDKRSVVLNLRAVQVRVPEAVKGAAVANEIFHQRFTVTENVTIPLSFEPRTPGTKDRVQPDLVKYIARLREAERDQIEKGWAGVAYATHSEEEDGVIGDRRAIERRIATATTELHRRLAFSLSCLTFPLLGISLSLLLQRSSRIVPFFLGNLAVIGLFYPLLMVAVAMGDGGFVPPLSLAIPNLALLGLGTFLARKVILR